MSGWDRDDRGRGEHQRSPHPRDRDLDADDQHLKVIAREIAKETVSEMLVRLGLDPDKPVELQKDFGFLRGQREFYSAAVRHGVFAVIATIVIGVLAAIWSAIRLKGG